MDNNPFLMSFIKMRKALNANPTESNVSLVNPKAGRTPASLISTEAEKPVRKGDITFKKIVESKVGKTKVVEYLRRHIEELKPLYID